MDFFFHNGPFVAIIAEGLIGISLVWDKVLLKSPGTRNLLSYVFWLGALSVFGVILVPFGYKSPSIEIIGIGFAAGVADLAGSFFYYSALKHGEASETLAVMGGFSPVATVLIALPLLSLHMTGTQLFGFALMCGGGFVMFLSEKLPIKKLWLPVVMAAGLMGAANVLEKVVYNQTNFVTGYVWFTIGSFAAAVALLVPPSWRQQIFSESGQSNPRSRFWYFVNRFVAGIGAFLVVYAISLANPAIVDSISGVRYVVIFIGAFLLTQFRPDWLKEDFGGWQLVTKTAGTLLVVAGLVLVGMSGGNKAGGAGGSGPAASVRPPTLRKSIERAGLRTRINASAIRGVIRPDRFPFKPAQSPGQVCPLRFGQSVRLCLSALSGQRAGSG